MSVTMLVLKYIWLVVSDASSHISAFSMLLQQLTMMMMMMMMKLPILPCAEKLES